MRTASSGTLDSTVCIADHTDITGVILSLDLYRTILLKLAGYRQPETKLLQSKMTLAEQSCAGHESWPLHSKTIIWVWASVVSKLPAAQRLLPFCVTQRSDMLMHSLASPVTIRRRFFSGLMWLAVVAGRFWKISLFFKCMMFACLCSDAAFAWLEWPAEAEVGLRKVNSPVFESQPVSVMTVYGCFVCTRIFISARREAGCGSALMHRTGESSLWAAALAESDWRCQALAPQSEKAGWKEKRREGEKWR